MATPTRCAGAARCGDGVAERLVDLLLTRVPFTAEDIQDALASIVDPGGDPGNDDMMTMRQHDGVPSRGRRSGPERKYY